MTFSEQYEERLAQFHERLTEEETDTFLRSMATLGEVVELGFGPKAARDAMSELHQQLIGSEIPGEADWREIWADLTASSDGHFTPAMEQAADLHAFAYYGILASWQLPEPLPTALELSRTDVPAYIEQVIDLCERFMRLFGADAPTWGFEAIRQTILAARGRLKVDSDLPMTVHELAALSRVIPKRVQNAIYAKSDRAPVVDANGLITPASARQWLEDRSYLPSLWQSRLKEPQEPTSALTDAPSEDGGEDEFVFVPEAADGSLFAPIGCRRGAPDDVRYTVGDKGSERTIGDYDDALAELTRMVNPKWRRPTPTGNWGIVRAERWRRIRRADLERL